ncbi:MAG: trimethylamine methyltransferase family protein [Deltaproteobacteria bacterium]|nr:trimethylamine methyltransferase family protein [Deltaproteobacteria bacterium]
MKPVLNLLSADEKEALHERSLRVLSTTGVKVETGRGRACLARYGAQVGGKNHVVRLPREVVERALQSVPRRFSLGARRTGRDLPMNTGGCTLLMSGEGTRAIDRVTGEYRDSTFDDWLAATRLADALDEIGVYWCIVTATDRKGTMRDYVDYLYSLFANFSKHVQDVVASTDHAVWLKEALQIVFGSTNEIRQKKPLSLVLCPESPLRIDARYTEAYLELAGYGLPVAVVPMPLMGATAPASLASTLLMANCEILATLTLVQAAEEGVPVIYAPVSALMDPRTGCVKSGAVEHGLISAASTEMARYYGLAAQTSGLGTAAFTPGIQSSYQAAMTASLAVMARPDILEGAGLLGSSMILSLEKMMIDVEIFNACLHAGKGIPTGGDRWMEDLIDEKGPGGHFLDHPSTLEALRAGVWQMSGLERSWSFEEWDDGGRETLLGRSRRQVDRILASHRSLPLGDEIDGEFQRLKKKACE